MRFFPIHAESTAVHEDNNEWLAGAGERLHQVLFWLGHVEAGAVAAGKARLFNWHLFAFEAAGDADDRDHYVCIFRCSDGGGINCIVHTIPNKLRSNFALTATVVGHIELRRRSLLQVDLAELCTVPPS